MSNPVLEKIYSLIGDETANQLGVHTQALSFKSKSNSAQLRFLHHELSSMRGALEDLADMEDPDNGTKAWRNEVSELYYDTEDCIDDFRHRIEAGGGQAAGFMRRAGHLLETLMARYQISRKIKELRTRAQEANDRRTRYKFDDECVSRSARVSVDPRISALYAETSSLVGIDAPKEEVVKLLTENLELRVDGASLKELRVVSIVGFGGLGKTTLANQVYRDLRDNLSGNPEESFSCKAIISVSQRPDMINLLKSLFSKVSGQSVDDTYDLQGLIDIVRDYLQGKRYLLVIDDLWDPSAWEIIKCAFPESHCGSRVLTTTRIESVAVACCNYQWKFVYRMQPLDDYHSRQLFLRRIFVSADRCPEPFEGLSEKILQKCGGLPLAIITIASLLASQQTRSIEQWKYVLSSIRHNLGLSSTLEGMRQILNLSYIHLPHPLKSCLLYIGMYPEDYEIQREDLVTQCVAEGFISGVVDGSEAVEVAGSFLNELVNRSMIIQRIKYGAKGEHISYRVHDMVLDLILCKSTEENFLCAVQNLQAASNTRSRLSGQQQNKARRFSLQLHDRNLGVIESAGRINLPHVRSLIVFRWPAPTLSLLELKFLRVLHIVLATDDLDLTLICKLFQLRYLCVRGKHKGLQLPVEIRGLKHLQVLDVISGLSSSSSGIPRDVVHLPALLRLQFPLTAVYPDGIGNMRCLHTLLQFDASKQSVANMLALGELLNLRVLDLWITDVSFATKEAEMDALMSSLEKLISSCNLKTLSILARDNVGRHSRWISLCFSCSQQAQLEQLYLHVWSPRMPAWVCQLRALSVLKINVLELWKDDVAVLAGLPALSRLILDVRNRNVPGCQQQQGIVFSADTSFRLLGYLRIPYYAEAGVTFEAGSMAKVETIRFPLRADDVKRWGVRISAVQHLLNLKQVLVDLRYGDCDESEKPIIRAAVRSAFDAHSAPSSIQFEFY